MALRIPADPRLAVVSAEIAESVLAVLAAHGYAIVRAADSSYVDTQRHADFAREVGNNACAVVVVALEERAA